MPKKVVLTSALWTGSTATERMEGIRRRGRLRAIQSETLYDDRILKYILSMERIGCLLLLLDSINIFTLLARIKGGNHHVINPNAGAMLNPFSIFNLKNISYKYSSWTVQKM